MGMFLHSFNGKSYFLEEAWTTSGQLRFYTDAAKSKGYGIVFRSHWAYGEWTTNWKNERDFSFLEFVPIVAGLSLWCHQLRNKKVLFMTDTESVVHVINKQTCDDVFSVCYQRKLIKAMYALAFFAALRVGEITGGPGQQTKNVITINQFFFLRDELNNIVAVKLVLIHYKHSDPRKPVELLMYREHPISPVSLMLDYVTLRGSLPGATLLLG